MKMDKPRSNSFKRQVWLYDRADFGAYKNNLLVTDWDSIVNDNKQIDTIASELTEKLTEIATLHIPNKIVTIRQNDLPWLNNNIRQLMRKRNRLRKKAKKQNSHYLWSKFKKIRNSVVELLRHKNIS